MKIGGRSSRLTINYRTTAEILGWSVGLLSGESVDDMDEGLETLAGCRSDVHGPLPARAGFAMKTQELEGLATRVQGWLDRSGIKAVSLAKMRKGDAVRVGTMHRMKGWNSAAWP